MRTIFLFALFFPAIDFAVSMIQGSTLWVGGIGIAIGHRRFLVAADPLEDVRGHVHQVPGAGRARGPQPVGRGLRPLGVGGLQQFRYLFDIGRDKALKHALGILNGQANGRVQAFQLAIQLSGQLARAGFVLVGALDQLAQGGGVHEGS